MFKAGRLINQLRAGFSRENLPAATGVEGSGADLTAPDPVGAMQSGDSNFVADSPIGADVQRITDYTDGEDRLLIGYDPAEITSPTITLKAQSDLSGSYAVVFLNGRAVCRVDDPVSGVTIAAEDIALVDISKVPEVIEPSGPVQLSA